MAIEVRGEYYLQIDINGYQLPLSLTNVIDCLLIENNLQALPTFSLTYHDQSSIGTLSDLFVDGAIMNVQIGKDREKFEIKSMQFRIIGQPQHSAQAGGTVFKINAVLNAPKWIHAMGTSPITSTSTHALETIAKLCGLKFSGDPSVDKQVWYPARRSYARWSQAICDSGWFGAEGCSVMGVGLDGVLQYRNLAVHPFKNPRALFNADSMQSAAPGATLHYIREFAVVSNAMLSNHTAGYPTKQHSINVDGSFNEPSQVTTKRVSKTTVNTQVAKDIKQTRTKYAPPNSGNVHDNYHNALYQNNRLRSLWSTDVLVMVDSQTGVSLFDPVEVSLPQHNAEEYSRFSGRYIVGARTIFIRSGSYGEKLELTSQGPKTSNVLS